MSESTKSLTEREQNNETTIRKFLKEVWEGKNLEVAYELLSPDIVFHSNYLDVHGIDEWKNSIYEVASQGISDLQGIVEGVLAKGDSVVVRCRFTGVHSGELFGVKPSGRSIEFRGIIWAEIVDGKIAEVWNSLDFDNLIRMVGAEVKTLKGFLPICASCKKIRDDEGHWNTVEAYVQSHSETLFSHGICTECEEKLYGEQEWYKKRKAHKR